MRLTLALLTFALLAACGADGQPEPPKPGMTVGGDVKFGIIVGPDIGPENDN